MTAADVRVPRARLIVGAAAVTVCAALLLLTRTYTFYFDEWTFITSAPDWTLRTYFEPHNEHPVMLLKLVYSLLLATAGLRTYLPYMGALLVAHAANVLLLFELVRRRAGDVAAMAAALVMLVLGAGWEDLLWAFQVGWLASMAFGLGAMLALERRPALAAALLTVSLSFAGTGIVFAVAIAVQLLLTPGRRRDLLWFAAPALALAAWYLAFGRFGEHPNPQPTAANILIDPLYALWGLSQGVAGIVGAAGWIGYPLLAVALAVLAWHWWRGGLDPFSAGIAAGLLAFFLVAGLTRAQLGWQQSGASRYVYVAALMWLVLLGDAARRLPWRGTWRPAIAACIFLACFNSAVVLFEYSSAKTLQMQRATADLQALAAMRDDPCLDPTGNADVLIMPGVTPPAYYRAVDRYGDPVAGTPVRDQADFEAAMSRLRKTNC
jgi:hypothetical protein